MTVPEDRKRKEWEKALKDFSEIQQKSQKEIDKHEKECAIFGILLKDGFITKQEGAVSNYYFLNLINHKDRVESHMVYNCPFCFARLMIPVYTGDDTL